MRLYCELHDGKVMDLSGENAFGSVDNLRVAIMTKGGATRVVLHEVGAPHVSYVQNPSAAFIKNLYVLAPEHLDLWFNPWTGKDLFKIFGGLIWEIITPDTTRPRHTRNPLSYDYYMMDGGSQLWLDFVPIGTHPYKMPESFTQEDIQKAKQWLRAGDFPTSASGSFQEYPLYSRQELILRSYRGADIGEDNVSMHTLGGYMIKKNFEKRFGGSVHTEFGPHGFGRIPWAKVASNGHYDQLELLTWNAISVPEEDISPWGLACIHARHKLTQGTICSKGHLFSYYDRYEATSLDYTGDFLHPQRSHMWPAGLILWNLFAKDELVAILLEERLSEFLKLKSDWQRAWGVRGEAWMLRGYRAYLELLGKESVKNVVETWLDDLFAALGSYPYWPNEAHQGTSPTSISCDPWQNDVLMYEIWEWFQHGIGLRHRAKWLELAKYEADSIHEHTATTYRVPYDVQNSLKSWYFTDQLNVRAVPFLWALKEEDPKYTIHWELAKNSLSSIPLDIRWGHPSWPGTYTKVFSTYMWARPKFLV
jgi:hypothetical protein